MPTAILKNSRNGRKSADSADPAVAPAGKSGVSPDKSKTNAASPLLLRQQAGRLSSVQNEQIASYIRARRVAAEANAILEKLKEPVLSIVGMAGGTISMMDAMVRIGQSVSYEYPATIRNQEDKLKNLKKIMQLDGRAEKIERPCLQFSEVRSKG